MLKGIAAEGTPFEKEFTLESPEVIAYREKYPDVTEEASIGSVISEYENSISKSEDPNDAPKAE